MRYIVETRCYWNGRLYNRGEVVEFDPSVDVPEHFKAAEPVEEVTPEPVDEGVSEEAPEKPTRREKG